MPQGVTLSNGSFSRDFAERMKAYYRFADPDGRYAERRLRQWEGDGGVILYEAKRESGLLGWIVYRPDSSTLEEILVRKGEAKGLEGAIVDALIDRESLVSAEVLKEDEGKYRWMIEYGFRPTRRRGRGGPWPSRRRR